MNTPRKNPATPRRQSSAVAESQPSVPAETQTFTLPFRAGDVIAEKYEVVGALGVGGVAFVISALHLELHEMVALKFLRPESLAHDEVVARFASEARAVARIKNEHVAHVFDVGWLPESGPYIVMEHLEGKDLADILAERGAVSIKVAVDYVLQACEALACAHATGIVHRDIKPENLFLARQAASAEVIKVLDFGISKSAQAAPDASNRRAHTMLPMGTPGYMSPEQIRACATVDARTDIWALGCVLSELLTDRATFEAPTVMQLSATILERNPIPLRKTLPDAPPALEALISKCLEKRPEARFQDVAELATALYPFGPRRARLSVERCHQILRGQSGALIEFNSVPPPSGEPLTPPPVSSTAAVVSAMPASGALGPAHTNAPAVMSAGAPDGLKPKRSRAIVLAGVALLGLTGLALALRGGAGAQPSAAAGQALTEPQAAPGPAQTPASRPQATAAAAPVSPESSAKPSETEVEPATSGKPTRAKARPSRPSSRPPRPTAAPSNPSPQAPKRVVVDDSEPDVGY